MKIILYKNLNFESNEPYLFTYEGYRSGILKKNDNPIIFGESKNIDCNFDESSQDDLIKLIKSTFDIKAFLSFKSFTGKEEPCIHEVKPVNRFEDLVINKKKKWLTCLNPNIFLQAVSSIYINLINKGSAILCFDKNNFNNIEFLFELLNLLACSFEQIKIGEYFVVLDNFSEKNKKTIIKYLHYCFDKKQEVKIFKEINNKKLIKFFKN